MLAQGTSLTAVSLPVLPPAVSGPSTRPAPTDAPAVDSSTSLPLVALMPESATASSRKRQQLQPLALSGHHYSLCPVCGVPSRWFHPFAMAFDSADNSFPASVPFDHHDISFEGAIHDPAWQRLMTEEIDSILQNKSWSLVPLPNGVKPISCKWVFKIQEGLTPYQPKLKLRLVAQGFLQQEGRDFLETFAPVVKWATIRIVFAIAIYRSGMDNVPP
jgi:hypothetical protein